MPARTTDPRILAEPEEPEVHEHNTPVRLDQHIARLDVAVNNAPSVQESQRFYELAKVGQKRFEAVLLDDRLLPLARRELVGERGRRGVVGGKGLTGFGHRRNAAAPVSIERSTADALHDQSGLSAERPQSMVSDDIAMPDDGERSKLALERGDTSGLVGPQELCGKRAVIGDAPDRNDFTEPTAPERTFVVVALVGECAHPLEGVRLAFDGGDLVHLSTRAVYCRYPTDRGTRQAATQGWV
jgi:hypothetical protein